MISVYDDNILPFFREFNVFSIENFKFYFKSWTLQRMSHMTKHVSKAGKVGPGCLPFTENFGNSGWKVNSKVTFRKFQPKIEEYVLR